MGYDVLLCFLFQCCDKSKLQSICKDDPSTWPFVFYQKTMKDFHCRFESAAYNGWFIHTKPSGLVYVTQETIYKESNFYFFIMEKEWKQIVVFTGQE